MSMEGSAPERIKLGMVGGGQGAFIGAVHRMAARLDGHFDLVAGALSSTPEKSRASGRELGLDPDRTYGDFASMAEAEAARSDGIEAVAIVTPNHMHFPVAEAFLKKDIHVICDKPMTTTIEEARELHALAQKAGLAFILTHNYSGYPMIRQAREMVADGELGTIRVIQAEYAQGWLSERQENKQAEWRTDPNRAGAGGSIGDIGTHAFQLANFVTGLEAEKLAADLTAFVPGRELDDNAHIMLRYAGGAKGVIWTSQVAVGKENGLRLRVYGEKGGLEWSQEDPNYLWHSAEGKPLALITRGGAGSGDAAARVTRVPPGHPEGYLEGFATIYTDAAAIIRAKQQGKSVPAGVMAPGTRDGIAGVAFIEACVRSNAQNSAWVEI